MNDLIANDRSPDAETDTGPVYGNGELSVIALAYVAVCYIAAALALKAWEWLA